MLNDDGLFQALSARKSGRAWVMLRSFALAASVLLALPMAHAQTLYSETFEGTHGWTLNVATGPNGPDYNFWVVNDNEGGMEPGNCGVAANGNPSLHVTSVFNPAGGAGYDAGGLCGFLFCPETNRRAESPEFSTLGRSNLLLSFNFIANGDGLIDNASVYYDSGLGWTLLSASIKSAVCGNGTGLWTRYEAALPADASNQASVRIGIQWTSNDDGVGTDPSVAIDNVQVYSPTIEIFDNGFE